MVDQFVQVPPDSTGKKLFTQEHVVGVDTVQAQVMHLADEQTPTNLSAIDESGALFTRFAEGKPQMDAFGKLRVSTGTLLGDYIFSEGVKSTAFSNQISQLGASTTWSAAQRALVLQCDAGFDFTGGGHAYDFVRTIYASNTYHHYFPGSSHNWLMAVKLDDAGEANLIREWGMHDSLNGFGFRHIDGVLSCFVRSDVTGTTAGFGNEEVGPWAQAQWNVDPLDGTGPSGMTIDATKDNVYWSDVSWLGGGAVRFGVYYNGERIVCHRYDHSNTAPYSMTGTASLPITFAQIGTGVLAANRSMRAFCGGVWTETDLRPQDFGLPRTLQQTHTMSGALNTYEHAVTVRPIEHHATGRENHTIYFPTDIHAMMFDSVTGDPVLGEVEVRVESVVGDTAFTTKTETVQSSGTGTYYGGGRAVVERPFRGEGFVDLTSIFTDMSSSSLKNYAHHGGDIPRTVASINVATSEITFPDGFCRFRDSSKILHLMNATFGTGGVFPDTYCYFKVTGLNSGILHSDEELTTPVDFTGYSGYTADTGFLMGEFGANFQFTVVAKQLIASTNPATLLFNLSWKEINQ